MSEEREIEFKDNGYTYCPVCDGTKCGPNMDNYFEYIPLDFSLEIGVCFCQYCGRRGKIDYISYAMGERFIGDFEGEIDISSKEYFGFLNDFVVMYNLFFIDEILLHILEMDDEPDEIRKNLYDWLSNINNYPRMVFFLRDETILENYFNLDILEMISELFNDNILVSDSILEYIDNSIKYHIITEIINIAKENLINGRTLTTSGLKIIKSYIEFIGYRFRDKERVSGFVGSMDYALYEMISVNVDELFKKMGFKFKTFKDFVEMIQSTEDSKRTILSEEEAREMGLLTF